MRGGSLGSKIIAGASSISSNNSNSNNIFQITTEQQQPQQRSTVLNCPQEIQQQHLQQLLQQWLGRQQQQQQQQHFTSGSVHVIDDPQQFTSKTNIERRQVARRQFALKRLSTSRHKSSEDGKPHPQQQLQDQQTGFIGKKPTSKTAKTSRSAKRSSTNVCIERVEWTKSIENNNINKINNKSFGKSTGNSSKTSS